MMWQLELYRTNKMKRKVEEEKVYCGEVKENYSSENYWDDRYHQNEGFCEWYFTFENLKNLFDGCVNEESDILEIGCGDSPLVHSFAKLSHVGKLYAIDYSKKIVDFAKTSKQVDVNPILYSKMDARDMSYNASMFDCIIDKGTCDAMLCNDTEGFDNVLAIMQESVRTLKTLTPSSIFIISHMEPESEQWADVLENCVLPALDDKREVHWKIEAHVCESNEEPPKPTTNSKKNKKGNNDAKEAQTTATVYIIKSTPKRFTRGMLSGVQDVPFEIHFHDNEDDDEE